MTALASWLTEQDSALSCLAAGSVAEAIVLAVEPRPHVVLLDFHGMTGSIAHTVARFKELTPPPAVFVLTHDASPTMRRHCRDVRVDAVFDKTAELVALSGALKALRENRPQPENPHAST